MAGELEDFLGSGLQWDNWTLSIVNMVTRVAALVNKKVLALPLSPDTTHGAATRRSVLAGRGTSGAVLQGSQMDSARN